MKSIEKWADRVYSETDFGRGVATSSSGLFGLGAYLTMNDWVIAAFVSIITFPIVRIVSAGLNEKFSRKNQRNIERENALHIYKKLGSEEKYVIRAYVRAGGSVLTWGQMNNKDVSLASIESLVQRGLIWTSTTADGMRETFALDSDIFDIANEEYENNKTS